MNVRLTAEQKKIKVANTDDVVAIMQEVLTRENKLRRAQEHFWVVGLNNGNKILFIELVALGASNRVQVAPPEVFRMAIYKLATQLILVHNHPSGSLNFSAADKDLTDRMIKSGAMLKIDVIDHLIVTEEDHFSFEANGLMQELRNSGRYELLDRERANLLEMQTEAAVDARVKELAKAMLDSGYSTDEIKRLTGLTKTAIKYLK